MLLDGRFRFDNYVVGSANRLAVAAARAVAEAPGSVYNPLFVYSGSGLGKTHLLGALAHAARQVQPGLRAEYASLDDFVEQLHEAISSGQADAFKRRFQELDLLVLDDVQFLTGRRETQSEMLRIFNALASRGGQIVMASDRPPTDIADVDERLVSRLSGGLVVDIGVPDFETRVAILRHKCAERGLSFPSGVLEELGQQPVANVRELQGALNRLVAHQSVSDAPLTPADVRAITATRPITPARATPMGVPAIASQPAQPTPVAVAAVPTGLGSPATALDEIGSGGDEFASFLADIAVAVAQSVEEWRAQIGAAASHWSAEGFSTAPFDRILALGIEPDVAGVIGEFEAAAAHLRALREEAIEIDPALGARELWRDTERVAEAEALLAEARASLEAVPGPSAAWTRHSFEMSASNQVAVRAAEAVILEPGARYNPLFVHGPAGVGKTHLAQAVGNALQERTAGARVACVDGATFVEECIAAIQDGTVERWRSRYRQASALIVDGVEALSGTQRSQDELFHLFNAFHESGRQVVIVSDRAPAELPELEARLRSRFEGGLVVAMQPPDRPLRARLLGRMLAEAGTDPETDLLDYLADVPLEGADDMRALVRRLAERASRERTEITLSVARRELADEPVVPTPTMLPAVEAVFLDAEKMLLDWADVDGRVIEDFR